MASTVDLIVAREGSSRDPVVDGVVDLWVAGDGFAEVPEGNFLFRFGQNGRDWRWRGRRSVGGSRWWRWQGSGRWWRWW